MLQFSLVFMLQERGPRQKTRLMTDIITFRVGNSTILNQGGKTKILSYVACFYSKCLAKIVFWRAASWLKVHGSVINYEIESDDGEALKNKTWTLNGTEPILQTGVKKSTRPWAHASQGERLKRNRFRLIKLASLHLR